MKAQLIADKESGLFVAAAVGIGKGGGATGPDLTLFKTSRVRMPARVVPSCLADLGYAGLQERVAGARLPKRKPPRRSLSRQEKRANRVQRSERVLIEHLIRRLKVFRILSSRYRNRRKRFGLRLNLIAALCNKETRLARRLERDL
jgi:hypothetical protein